LDVADVYRRSHGARHLPGGRHVSATTRALCERCTTRRPAHVAGLAPSDMAINVAVTNTVSLVTGARRRRSRRWRRRRAARGIAGEAPALHDR